MEEYTLLTKGELQVPCYLTAPEEEEPRFLILSVHGLGGSARDKIQSSLAEEMGLFNSATVRFDFPGHGRSPMEGDAFTLQNCMDALMAAAVYTKERFPRVREHCLFATGFGAYVTLLCLPRLQALAGRVRLVLQTPSIRMHDSLLSMLRVSRQTLWAMEKYTLPLPRPLPLTYDFYESLRQNSAMISCAQPMLILQGERDEYILREDLEEFLRLNENARLVVFPGVGHRFMEEGAWDRVLDLTRDWFAFEQVLLCDWE